MCDLASPDEVLTALRRFGLQNDRLDAVVARRVGAPPVEFKAMDHLHEAGELTPGQLADRLALTSGAVTAVVDRLERLGWVTREPHPTDRRSVVIRRSSRRGLSEAETIYGDVGRRVARAAARMSAAEREAMVRFLEEATEVAAASADDLRADGV